jgi:hypothetical protein
MIQELKLTLASYEVVLKEHYWLLHVYFDLNETTARRENKISAAVRTD